VALIDEFSRDRAGPTPKGISHDCIAALGGNDNTHADLVGGASINDEVCRNSLVTATNYLTKIAGLNDAVVTRQHHGGLNSDFAAALAAAGGKNRTTGTRTHTQTEAVNLRTTAVIGLVGTLRHLFSSASGRHSQVE